MYKCQECSKEFEIKPDYCDCGNDTFIEVEIDKEENEEKEVKEENSEYQSVIKRNLPSIIFFIICVIFAFIIIFFIGNPKEQAAPVKNIDNEVKNIPDINKLWNDKKPVITTFVEVPKPNTEVKPVENKPQAQAKTNTIAKTKPQVQIKPQVQAKPPVQTKSPVQTKTQAQTTKTQAAKPQTQTTKTPQTAAPVQVQKPVQSVSKPLNIQVQNQHTALELKQYKKSLRNKIAYNIDFLNIAGDGRCTLTFNIAQSGALQNRKFTSQSQNTSLNDAVYSAMMKVPSFKVPPTGYKGETLKLSVKISGGNFEVSLE